MLEFI